MSALGRREPVLTCAECGRTYPRDLWGPRSKTCSPHCYRQRRNRRARQLYRWRVETAELRERHELEQAGQLTITDTPLTSVPPQPVLA